LAWRASRLEGREPPHQAARSAAHLGQKRQRQDDAAPGGVRLLRPEQGASTWLGRSISDVRSDYQQALAYASQSRRSRRSDRAGEPALHGGLKRRTSAPSSALVAAHRCRTLCGSSRAGAVGRAAAARRHGPVLGMALLSGCSTNRSPILMRGLGDLCGPHCRARECGWHGGRPSRTMSSSFRLRRAGWNFRDERAAPCRFSSDVNCVSVSASGQLLQPWCSF